VAHTHGRDDTTSVSCLIIGKQAKNESVQFYGTARNTEEKMDSNSWEMPNDMNKKYILMYRRGIRNSNVIHIIS
jgi:hypothetical protein